MRKNVFFTPTRCNSCEANLEGSRDISETILINEYRLLVRCRRCKEWTPTWSIVTVPKGFDVKVAVSGEVLELETLQV